MLLFLFLQAEIDVIDNKLDALKENQEEVKKGITGEEAEESTSNKMKQDIKSTVKKAALPEYNSAKICIAQGGLPPSNDTAAADIREIHESSSKQPDRPMIVACGHTDVFEKSNRLREPGTIPNAA